MEVSWGFELGLITSKLNKLVSKLTSLNLVLRMATQKFDVEKFTGENYFHLWKLKMRALLVHLGIKKVMEDVKTWTKISKITDEDIQDAMDKAHNTIILSLGDSVLREIGDHTTAANLWKKLEDLYTKQSLTKRFSARKRLHVIKMVIIQQVFN